MEYYAVKYALTTTIGKLSLPEPYVYEAESIPQLVADIAPTCEDCHLTIVSIRPATDAEVYNYLRGDVADDESDPEWDEPEDGYDEFWENLIADLDED